MPYYVHDVLPIVFGDRVMEVKNLLNLLEAKNVILPVSETSEWAAPLFVIRNVNSGKRSLCLRDQTRLNESVSSILTANN